MDGFQGIRLELGDAVSPVVIKLGNKEWKIGPPTQAAKGELEGSVVQVAERNLELLKPFWSAAKYKQEEAELRNAIRGGHWKTWGQLWATIINSPDGNTLFLLSLMREKHLEATFEDAQALWREKTEEVKKAFALQIPSFFAILVTYLPGTPEERAKALADSVEDTFASLKIPLPKKHSDSPASTTS